jgi:hypothetical protein
MSQLAQEEPAVSAWAGKLEACLFMSPELLFFKRTPLRSRRYFYQTWEAICQKLETIGGTGDVIV